MGVLMMEAIYFAMFALLPLMAAVVVLGLRDIVRTLKAAAPTPPACPIILDKTLEKNNFALAA